MGENAYSDPFSPHSKCITAQFDSAVYARDTLKLINLVGLALDVLDAEDDASQARIYYSLGTVYGDLSRLTSENTIDLHVRQLFYFRKSMFLVESDACKSQEYLPYINALKASLYTNYGNALEHCGRIIAAINQYKKALSIRDKFGMALGNLGMAYRHYGFLMSNPEDRDILHHFAYSMLNSALCINDENTYSEAKAYFGAAITSYDSEYTRCFLLKPLTIENAKYSLKKEQKYRTWAWKNGFFLNPLNDLNDTELIFAYDTIQLPSISTDIYQKPIYHGIFNQIKQEYIFARYQFYTSQEFASKVHFADKDTYLVNLPDYPQYSLRIENLKTAFRTLFSLLDKVAFFINSYFHLGIQERDITFSSIWDSKKNGKQSYQYQNTLDFTNNYPLKAIYWISRDYYMKYLDSPNPYLKRTSTIRNALEHKYVKVIWCDSEEVDDESKDGLAFYITEAELAIETHRLLDILREVIIYLSMAVAINEEKRIAQLDTERIPLVMPLQIFDDDWKL